MPNDHALLSPSSSHRWLNCTPSPSLESEFDNVSGPAAEEGTAAHALCEHKLKRILKIRSKRPVSKYDSDEMEENSDAYVEFVQEQIAACKEPIVLIEQKVDFSKYVPDGFGTADCLIISDGVVHIVDYKNGAGVLVEIQDNPQLKCYALGALSMFDMLYDIEEVKMSIFQPRRENVGTWTMAADEIRAWGENVLKQKALLAIDGKGECNPGEWCTFCRAAVKCRARAEQHMKLAQQEFKLPPILSDIEIEGILADIPNLTKWANEIMAYATEAAVNHDIRFSYESGFLFITLPSGRKLAYIKPRMGENQFGGEAVTYEGIGNTKKWDRMESYGPKFVENITQAIARDVLVYAMGTLRNYRIVGHVHDELIIEADKDVSVDAICEQMGRTPPWASGLKLRADGYECKFYKKD